MMIKAKVVVTTLVLSTASISGIAEPFAPGAGLLDMLTGSIGVPGLNMLGQTPIVFDALGVNFLSGGFGQLPLVGDLGGVDLRLMGLDEFPIDVAGVLGQGNSGEPAVMLPYNPLPLAITTLGSLSFLDSLPGTEVIVMGLDTIDALPL